GVLPPPGPASRLALGEVQPCPPTAEQSGEDPLEALVHHLEGLVESLAAGAVDAGDGLAQRLEARLQIGLLTGQEAVPFRHLLVLLHGGDVDLPPPLPP